MENTSYVFLYRLHTFDEFLGGIRNGRLGKSGEAKKRFEAETKVKEAKAAAIAKRLAAEKIVEQPVAAEGDATPSAE